MNQPRISLEPGARDSESHSLQETPKTKERTAVEERKKKKSKSQTPTAKKKPKEYIKQERRGGQKNSPEGKKDQRGLDHLLT